MVVGQAKMTKTSKYSPKAKKSLGGAEKLVKCPICSSKRVIYRLDEKKIDKIYICCKCDYTWKEKYD